MKLKEIKSLKEKPIRKFKNFQEELNFIKKEKKNKGEKLLQQDIRKISRNIIKDKVIIKKFVETLLKFCKTYNKPGTPPMDWIKYDKIIKIYKQKIIYSNTEEYLNIIGLDIWNNNLTLWQIREYIKQRYANGVDDKKIFTEIIGYHGDPLKEEIKIEINPLSLEINFKSSKDLLKFHDYFGIKKQAFRGVITYNILTICGRLKSIIIYNEEYITNLTKRGYSDFPNKKYLQKITRLHEQQHALSKYLWKKNIISTSNKSKTELIETIEFDRFIQSISNEILAHYWSGYPAIKNIPDYLAEKYHYLYKTLACIYLKNQIQNDNNEENYNNSNIQSEIEDKSQQEVKKYTDIAIHAIMSLEQAGYNKKEITSYLADENLTKWNLLAKRLIDNKDISQTK